MCAIPPLPALLTQPTGHLMTSSARDKGKFLIQLDKKHILDTYVKQ